MNASRYTIDTQIYMHCAYETIMLQSLRYFCMMKNVFAFIFDTIR